jgi:cation:H+ antiporter
MVWSFVLVILGVAFLYFGGEALVKGASHLARALGVSPLVVGLSVVAFATSAPELAVTVMATLADRDALAVGNVVGSNIANVGLILGSAALLGRIAANPSFLRREVPFMIAVSASLWPVLSNDQMSRPEGALLFAVLLLFLWYLLRTGRRPAESQELYATPPLSVWKSSLLVALGLALLVVGARVMVVGAVDIARALGVTERVIGLTMVAFGTSLPELASSLVAARRGQGDILLGNIVGSNVFNVLCVLGLAAAVRPLDVPYQSIELDFWVMMAFSLALLPVLHRRLPLQKLQGPFLLVPYLAYVTWLFVGK